MILQAKHSLVANLVVVLWICFMVTHCPCAPPANVEPIIYVTLARWENRTFSPRVYYVMMVRQQQQSNLNQVQEDPYPYESPIATTKLEEKYTRPFLSVRNSFHKDVLSSSSEFSKGDGVISSHNNNPHQENQENSTDASGSPNRGNPTSVPFEPDRNQSIQFVLMNDEERITFETPPEDEEEQIVFKDNIPTVHRRMHPEGFKETHSFTSPKTLSQCSVIRRNSFKNPRSLLQDNNVSQDIPTLQLSLQISRRRQRSQENFVFSPISILNIASLLLLGASDTTFTELSALVGIINCSSGSNISSHDVEKFHDDMSQTLFVLNNCSHPKVILETANEIFADVNYPLTRLYQEDAYKFYGASASAFDFQADGEKFQANVNAWVKEKTKGKINTIIDTPPSPLTTLALVNAIYFQGTWEIPFASHVTREGPFHVDKETTIHVPLMTNIVEIPYMDTKTFEIIRLPYKGAETALYIILPKTIGIDGLRDIEWDLSVGSLRDHMKTMSSQDPVQVTVKLPKMRVQSDGQVKDILTSLGVHTPFNASSANFSKISPIHGLHVSSLLHRAIVDINEKGTEAAAVSVATGDRIIGTNPIPFTVNRPFLFFIYNNLAETVLFWGRVLKPEPLTDSL